MKKENSVLFRNLLVVFSFIVLGRGNMVWGEDYNWKQRIEVAASPEALRDEMINAINQGKNLPRGGGDIAVPKDIASKSKLILKLSAAEAVTSASELRRQSRYCSDKITKVVDNVDKDIDLSYNIQGLPLPLPLPTFIPKTKPESDLSERCTQGALMFLGLCNIPAEVIDGNKVKVTISGISNSAHHIDLESAISVLYPISRMKKEPGNPRGSNNPYIEAARGVLKMGKELLDRTGFRGYIGPVEIPAGEGQE